MLTKWTLGNFKSINQEITLEMKPITVLVGANSSGKSTILQSILLISQTVRSSPSESPLIFNGEYVRLGYISDVMHKNRMNQSLTIGFEIDKAKTHLDGSKVESTLPIFMHMDIRAEQESDYEDAPWQAKLENLKLSWARGRQAFVIRELGNHFFKTQQKYTQMRLPLELRDAIDAGEYAHAISKSTLLHRFVHPYDNPLINLNHFLPKSIIETYDGFNYNLRRKLRGIAELLSEKQLDFTVQKQYHSLLVDLDVDSKENRGLRRHIRHIWESGKSTGSPYHSEKRKAASMLARESSLGGAIRILMRDVTPTYRKRMAKELRMSMDSIHMRKSNIPESEIAARVGELPQELQIAVNELTRFFSQNIYYLGPLRVEPQFIYNLPPFPEIKHVGLKGEFTAPVLEHFKGATIEYPLPPDKIGRKGKATDKGTLIYAVERWLDYMGLLEKVRTKDRGKMGTELTVRINGVDRELDLSSIGVGISQVLPSLVMGLVAPPGTTILLEQPELHLHPRIQSRLADFLLGLTRVGKQCIVETHSEYLVNRLRRRVAEDETNKLVDDVQIYFAEREHGVSRFRRVDLSPFGAVIDWPKGFFDDGPREAQKIMEASRRKRQSVKERSQRPGEEKRQ